jgi:hypothetical protein
VNGAAQRDGARLDQADEAYRTLDRGEITGRAIVVM